MDTDLLAQAMVTAFRAEAKDNWPFLRGSGWPAYQEHGNPAKTLVVRRIAERLAAEYARLSAQPEALMATKTKPDDWYSLGHVEPGDIAFHLAVCERCGLMLAYLARDHIACQAKLGAAGEVGRDCENC